MRNLLFTVIALASLSLWLIPTAAFARDHEAPKTITVSGTGIVNVTPDMATIRVGVSTRDKSPAKALKENTARVTKLFKTLEGFAIDKKDIQTNSFSVNPVYSRQRPPNSPSRIEAYNVTNLVTVRLREIDKLGAILEGLVTDGANRLNGLSFGVSNPTAKMNEARKLAVKDAKARADLLAQEAGVDVGDVLKITESRINQPRPMLQARSMMAAEAVPVAAGQQQISASVTIIYEID